MSDDQDRLENVPRILNHNKTRWEWISLHFPSYSNTRLSRSATIRESHSCFQYSSFLFCQEQTISQYFGGNRYPFTKTQAHVAAYRRILSPNSRRVSQGNLTTWEPANITRWSEEQAWFFGVFKVQICIIWVIYCKYPKINMFPLTDLPLVTWLVFRSRWHLPWRTIYQVIAENCQLLFD